MIYNKKSSRDTKDDSDVMRESQLQSWRRDAVVPARNATASGLGVG